MTRKAFIALMLALALASPVFSRTYALFTGVSNYQGDSHDLSLSTDDAKRLTKLYRDRNAKAVCLTGCHATSENIMAFANKLARICKPTDQVVFFFSGHGRNNEILTYDEENCLDYARLFQALREINCANIVIFIDACYSGSMYKQSGEDGIERLNKNLAENAGNNDKFIIFSSSRNYEVSYETQAMESSFFTDALLSGLRGHADADGNREITTMELFKYMHSTISRKLDNRQHPTLITNVKKNSDVVLAKLD